MKIPFEWLKEFVNISETPDSIAAKLPLTGLEVSVIENELNPKNPILEVDILPNRGDCQSVLGVAREVSAAFNSKLKFKKAKVREVSKRTSSVLKVEMRDYKLCPRYMARVIENIKVKESPEWIKKRLIAYGIRPINNIVDVTNYFLIALGQPMHAFDLNKLQAIKGDLKQIIIRRANPEEKLVTLDGVERALEKEMLVIADSERAIALAGVMGGANTEVSDNTTSIILESAYFDSISISKTSKVTKLRTEASIRFEKGVDWNMVEEALDKAAALISELSGGNVLYQKIDAKDKIRRPKVIELRHERVLKLLGVSIAPEISLKIIKKLGFKILKKDSKKIKVEIPSFRDHDIEREIDLIEEVARINGYNKIPVTISRIGKSSIILDNHSKISHIKEILVGTGLFEIHTFSIVNPKDAQDNAFKITNPLTYEESVLRTSIIPGILKVVSHNLRHQVDDIRIFEIGKIFIPGKEHQEKQLLSGAICYPNAAYFDIKGIMAVLLAEFTGDWEAIKVHDSLFHPNKSAGIFIKDTNETIGAFGLLHPEVLKKCDFSNEIFIFDIDLDKLLGLAKIKTYKSLPKFPKIERDIAMFVPEGVNYKDIVSLIKETSGDILESVRLFDIYKNSQAYRLSFRDKNATLTDEIVNEKVSYILTALGNKFKVQIRR